MKITKRKEFIYKSIGDIKEDDEVLTPDGKKHKIFSIQEQGNSDIYKIYISDGRIFRTHQKHLTPVCFRQKNGEEVWDCLTTEWMQKYIDRFHFTIIDNYSDLKVDDKYSLFYEHEAEPDDNIEPIIKDGPYITKIEKLNYSENCRCISLFDPEGLYYTNNGIITHNSTLSTLIQLFISTHYAMMWHPWKYFNLAPSSVFTQCLGAWNQKKASELLLEPFVQILEQSPYFKRVRSHTDLVDAAGNDLAEHLCWSTSTPTSCLAFQNGVNYKIINGPGSILGQNIISAVISEMTMFTDNGWTNDKIFTFFTKLRKRIDSRMKGNYYGRMIIDSQPNSLESVIDDWIWNEAPKSSENYIVTGSRWKYFPQEFPYAWETQRDNWNISAKGKVETKDAIKNALDQECMKKDFNKKDTFPIFKGTNGQPPKVVESETELTMYEPTDVVWAPTIQVTSNGNKSMLDAALESPIEFLRDQCGIPSGTPDRIFYNKSTVENCFENNLRNMFGHITAPAEEEPEHLIWNQIKDKFFNKIIDKYYFYYEPGIPRVVSVDQSYAGDVTSIAMTHVERDSERKDDVTGEPVKVYVTDFIITIIPKGGIINLDAIKCFIWDLVSLGNVQIKHVSYDGFQSQPSIQFLKRKGIDVDYISVDKTNEPYLNFIDYVQHKRWFAGKCIYMKNNMLSLHFEKRKQGKQTTKIEHFTGEIYTDGNGDWNTDMRGTNAKDAADAVTGTIELINRYENEFVPYVVWQPLALNDRSYETMKTKQNSFMSKMGFSIDED